MVLSIKGSPFHIEFSKNSISHQELKLNTLLFSLRFYNFIFQENIYHFKISCTCITMSFTYSPTLFLQLFLYLPKHVINSWFPESMFQFNIQIIECIFSNWKHFLKKSGFVPYVYGSKVWVVQVWKRNLHQRWIQFLMHTCSFFPTHVGFPSTSHTVYLSTGLGPMFPITHVAQGVSAMLSCEHRCCA